MVSLVADPECERLVGGWGIHPHLAQDLDSSAGAPVHPRDVNRVRDYHQPELVYYVEGTEDGYLCLRYRERGFRVRPSGFAPVGPPSCWFHDSILIRSSHGTLNTASVFGISWHYKLRRHYYTVEVKDRLIARRVFEEDIVEKV